MRVTRSENGLAVEIPADVAEALDLKEGDEVTVNIASGPVAETEREILRKEALERIQASKWTLPPGWKFDRDEANER